MQGSSIHYKAGKMHSIDESTSWYGNSEPVRTEYFSASTACLTIALIFDIASIAMMPLMARLVWLFAGKLSADDLCHHRLLVLCRPLIGQTHTEQKCRVLTLTNSWPKKSVADTISKSTGFVGKWSVSTYISTYEASIPTRASVSVSHDQHIPGFCIQVMNQKGKKTGAGGTNVQLLDHDLNCCQQP